jgi:hypothetical protein
VRASGRATCEIDFMAEELRRVRESGSYGR